MSYCRFSSDNWRCEVYCYADVSGGYTTHVAGTRIVGEIPTEPSFLELRDANTPEARAEWTARHKAVMTFLDTAERQPIGLAYDGETFRDADLDSFLERLETLRRVGYNVPQWAIDEVREELASCRAPRELGEE